MVTLIYSECKDCKNYKKCRRPYETEWMHYNVGAIKQQLKFNEQRHDAHRKNLKFTDDRLKLATNPQALNHRTVTGGTTKNTSSMLSKSSRENRILWKKYQRVRVEYKATVQSHPEHRM